MRLYYELVKTNCEKRTDKHFCMSKKLELHTLICGIYVMRQQVGGFNIVRTDCRKPNLAYGILLIGWSS